jgi:threonine dehydratase
MPTTRAPAPPLPTLPTLPTLADLEAAAALVRAAMPPTPQYRWPLLEARCGCEVWVKHENHTPAGAFKVRGGIVYFDHLARETPRPAGVVTATRGNHGQSVGLAARRHGIPAAIVVPHGNGREKNAAMRALGAELIEEGHDFQAASEAADALAGERGWHRMPSFHPLLVAGVGTYALELFRAAPALDAVYVPIGLGSGLCGVLAARDALGLATEVVGVVSAGAPAYVHSLAGGAPVSHEVTTTLADGMACRTPNADAFAMMRGRVARVVQVTDAEVAAAMRALFTDTHNVAEGGGAAALAALLQERDRMQGRRAAVVLSGGNVDAEVYARVLGAECALPG